MGTLPVTHPRQRKAYASLCPPRPVPLVLWLRADGSVGTRGARCFPRRRGAEQSA